MDSLSLVAPGWAIVNVQLPTPTIRTKPVESTVHTDVELDE